MRPDVPKMFPIQHFGREVCFTPFVNLYIHPLPIVPISGVAHQQSFQYAAYHAALGFPIKARACVSSRLYLGLPLGNLAMP